MNEDLTDEQKKQNEFMLSASKEMFKLNLVGKSLPPLNMKWDQFLDLYEERIEEKIRSKWDEKKIKKRKRKS